MPNQLVTKRKGRRKTPLGKISKIISQYLFSEVHLRMCSTTLRKKTRHEENEVLWEMGSPQKRQEAAHFQVENK